MSGFIEWVFGLSGLSFQHKLRFGQILKLWALRKMLPVPPGQAAFDRPGAIPTFYVDRGLVASANLAFKAWDEWHCLRFLIMRVLVVKAVSVLTAAEGY